MTLFNSSSNVGWYVFLAIVIVAVIAAVFASGAPDEGHLESEQAEHALRLAEPYGSSEAESEIKNQLANDLPIEHRGLNLPGDVIWSIPHAVVAGDHVDIAAILDRADLYFLPGETAENSQGKVVITVLQNIKVLERSEDGDITLEVVPAEAELLLLMAVNGSLALTLRNPNDLSTVPLMRQTLRLVLEELELYLDSREQRRLGPDHACPAGKFRHNGQCYPNIGLIR